MGKKLIFNKEEFVQFVINQVNILEPGIQAAIDEKAEDSLGLKLAHSDAIKETMLDLHNVWRDYCRVGDLNIIVDFLNSHFQINRYLRKHAANDAITINPRKILPVVRIMPIHQQFGTTMNYLMDDDIPGFDTVYAEDHTGSLLFLNEQMIGKSLKLDSKEAIRRQALLNLRRKGWLEPVENIGTIVPKAIIRVYERTSYPFQYQFFVEDMVQRHLPVPFLIAIPANGLAVVLTMRGGLTTLTEARQTVRQTGFNQFVDCCFYQEPRPLSRSILWVQKPGSQYSIY